MERGLDVEPEGGESRWERQSRLYRAVCWTARELSTRTGWQECIGGALERIGRAVGASRGFVVTRRSTVEPRCALEVRCSWSDDSLPADLGLGLGTLVDVGGLLDPWAEILRKGEVVRAPAASPSVVGAAGVTIVVAPVFTTEGWWGGVGFEAPDTLVEWSEVDLEVLQAFAGLVGGAVDRDLAHARSREALERSRRELEDKVRERTAELQGANAALEGEIAERRRAEAALERQAEALARSNAELEQFAYVASHDLQQPLVAVIGFLRLLEQRYASRLDDDGRTFIDQALDGANRMQLLIRDLLEYSRAESGETFARIAGDELLDAALSNLKPTVEESGARITRDPLPTVLGAATQLAQVFQNLIGNAIKFAGKGHPQVHVSAVRGDGEWLFSVSDDGIGIAPRDWEKIFRVFERLHGRAKFPGSGIGLAICKKVVERHGGRIWVDSQAGAGSTFYFTIPDRGSDEPTG